MNNLDIKQDHETAACQRFLSIYNSLKTKNINYLRLGNPHAKEPDCICSNNIAIELVGIYDNDYQASKMWNTARGRKTPQKIDIRLLTLQNLEHEVAKKLHKLSKGNYNGFTGKIILLCNLQSPLLVSKEVDMYIKEHSPFRNDGSFEQYFEEVWVTWRDIDEKWKIKQLE